MFPFRLFAATGTLVARLDSVDGVSLQTTIVLGGEHESHEGHIVNGVMCNTFQPHLPVPITNAATAPARSPFIEGSW